MGMIQSSLNQLNLSAIGAVGGLIKGFQGGFGKKPEAKKPEVKDVGPLTATNKEDGYTPRIGKRPYAKYKAMEAIISANDSIAQKAMTREAVNLRFAEIMGKGE